MNERIKELWDKVDLQEGSNPPSIVITSERELQEFAKLIVKECAEIAAVDSETIGDRIKGEFGME